MEAAILNLVVNAKDAMADTGKLTIETANVFVDELYSQQNADISGRSIHPDRGERYRSGHAEGSSGKSLRPVLYHQASPARAPGLA